MFRRKNKEPPVTAPAVQRDDDDNTTRPVVPPPMAAGMLHRSSGRRGDYSTTSAPARMMHMSSGRDGGYQPLRRTAGGRMMHVTSGRDGAFGPTAAPSVARPIRTEGTVHAHNLQCVRSTRVYESRNGEWFCDLCQATGPRDGEQFHCAECQWDACRNCALGQHIATVLHVHRLTIANPAVAYSVHNGAWHCDQCQRTYGPSDTMAHCAVCDWDACVTCLTDSAEANATASAGALAGAAAPATSTPLPLTAAAMNTSPPVAQGGPPASPPAAAWYDNGACLTCRTPVRPGNARAAKCGSCGATGSPYV